MKTEISESVELLEIPRKVWTREESHLLVELCFPNAEKLELVEGELIDRMGKKRPANPQPQDILLIVEISDSTLRIDLETKAKLYARAEIAEYWVVDIPGKQLIVHREPSRGNYANIVTYS